MCCYIWYNEERPGRATPLPSPLLAEPNVTAHHQRLVSQLHITRCDTILITSTPSQSLLLISVVTLSRPPTISLKITDRSFRYASPRFWNQLPDSFRQPRQSCLDLPPHPLVNPSFLSSPLSASITPSLFHSRLRTYLFNKSFPPVSCCSHTGNTV